MVAVQPAAERGAATGSVLAGAVWALALCAAAVRADLRAVGPYKIELESFGPCDDLPNGELFIDVHLVESDKGEPVYEGNITYLYDLGDPSMQVNVVAYRWGSTGGWTQCYALETDYDSITYSYFPNIHKAIFESIGVFNGSFPAGTYHMRNFRPMELQLARSSVLIYGRYKVVVKHILLEVKGCFQMTIIVKEAPVSQGLDSGTEGLQPAKEAVPFKNPFG